MIRACDNPFSTDRVLRVRYRPRGWTWEGLMGRLAAMNYHGAIVGPEGRGKTTLLEDLGARLPAVGLKPRAISLTRERPRFSRGFLDDFFGSVTPNDVILLDGAEQMCRWAWRGFVRRASSARGLVITSHCRGLLPTLVECETDEALLGEIVGSLHPPVAGDCDVIRSLFERHGGNVRDALRELYDTVGRRPLSS